VLQLEVGATFRSILGTLPQSPGFGPQPQLALRIGRLRAALGLTIGVAEQIASESRPGARLDASALLGELAIGIDLTGSPLGIWPSAVVELGELTIASLHVAEPSQRSSGWNAAGAGLHAARTLGYGFEVTLDAFLLLPFARPRWLLRTSDGAIPLFTTAPLAGRLSLGIARVFD
jgi:hypothetical protein